jgi:hypothetical protein
VARRARCRLRFAVDHLQEDAGRPLGDPSLLFPLLHRPQGEVETLRECFLGQTQALANRAHVGTSSHVAWRAKRRIVDLILVLPAFDVCFRGRVELLGVEPALSDSDRFVRFSHDSHSTCSFLGSMRGER